MHLKISKVLKKKVQVNPQSLRLGLSPHLLLAGQVGLGEERQAFGSHYSLPSLRSVQADEAVLSVLGAGPWLAALLAGSGSATRQVADLHQEAGGV